LITRPVYLKFYKKIPGEKMSGVPIIAISLAFLGLGYIFYGRFVARR